MKIDNNKLKLLVNQITTEQMNELFQQLNQEPVNYIKKTKKSKPKDTLTQNWIIKRQK